MATTFPAALDTLTDPVGGNQTLAAFGHAARHQDLNDAIEALQAKVGVDGSEDTNSIDYKLSIRSLIGHNHDLSYAALGHNHTGVYAAADHNHDLSYAALGHNHDLSYAALGHNHAGTYAVINHDHDLVYAALSHNHSGVYSPVGHDHSGTYATAAHTHATLAADDGTVSAPSIGFSGDTNTGIYRPADDTVAISTAGTKKVQVGPTGRIDVTTDAAASDPYLAQVELLLHMEGANGGAIFTDSSTYNRTLTKTGTPTTSTSQVKVGSTSGYFPTGSFLDYQPSASISGNFTVECWARKTAANTYMVLTEIGAYNNGLMVRCEGATNMVVYFNGTNATYTIPAVDTWFHVAIVRSGSTITTYVDGVSKGTITNSGNGNSGVALARVAGDRHNGGTQPFVGYVDEYRFTNGTARYSGNFTPSTTAFQDATTLSTDVSVALNGRLTVTGGVDRLSTPGGYISVNTTEPVAGKVLKAVSNTEAQWLTETATVLLTRTARTSNTIFGVSDHGKAFDYTSGTFSQTFTAAAVLGDGWYVYLLNSGTGTVTLDPNASETIDGATTITLGAGQGRVVMCNGSAFFTVATFGRTTTGTGALVFGTSPTLTTPAIGVATGTSLAATGAVTSSGTAGIGYATGAGGTVTQDTNKTTAVTLNKTTGLITTESSVLAAGARAVFQFNNSTIAATDFVGVALENTTIGSKYSVDVVGITSGWCQIAIKNETVGSLSEAPTIRFAVIKCVSA